MAKSYRCTECGTLLMNHAEMQEHAEDLGHQGFEEATEEIKIVYCCDCGKDCRNAVAQQMHTRNTGHSQFQDTRPEMKKAVPQAVGGAAPMDVDDSTVGAQALGMLPGIEALDEPGDTEGQSKMVRILDNSGNMVAAVFKWAAKEQKWNKHKEIVDEDQAADPEEIQKAFAAANAELLGPLMEMGFPEERCKKALLLTGNDSVEHGIQWLTEHVEDPLADAPMTIAQVKKALKPKMTPEEKAAKAAALQRKAKAERERREALEAIDREKRKREGVKKSTEQQRQLDEIERVRFIEAKKREKEAEQAERDRIKAKLAADRAERGFAPKEEDPQKEKTDFLGNKKVSAGPKLRAELRAIKNEHGDLKDAAFKALLAYVSNIIENPRDPKFRRINLTNKAFVTRVASCGEHGMNFLTLCGFQQGGRAEYIPEGKDPAGFIVCQSTEEGGDFDGEWMHTLKAARSELTKSIENPFWL